MVTMDANSVCFTLGSLSLVLNTLPLLSVSLLRGLFQVSAGGFCKTIAFPAL